MREGIAVDVAAVLGEHWRSLEWRLDNLYWIVNKDGKKTRFVMNDSQREFVKNLWYRNLILKSRQRGFSTLLQLMELDQALFNADHNGVVISDTLPNAGKLFGKIEYAWDHLAPDLKAALKVKSRTSRTGLGFGHGSEISVSTSSRGGTVQFLHVSELGKIARKYPERAKEIVTGAFESVPVDGCIVVESTAEGMAGEFWDLCDPAMKRLAEKAPETRLDWRLHFFPWYTDTDCRLSPEDAAIVVIPDRMAKYFREKEALLGVKFDLCQRAWYVKKAETLGRKMKQEYPSTPEEAFEQAVEGAIFGDEMAQVREKGRITVVPLDVAFPVNTFWDFGLGARNPIWLHQRIGMQNRWVKYFDDFGKGLGWWWRHLEEWRKENGEFAWGQHFLPHDADAEILGESVDTKHRILERAGMRNIVVVPRVAEKAIGIDLMRTALPADNWFDKAGTAEGVKCLDGYQFEWDDRLGVWSRTPLANWAAHGTDAWMQYAQGKSLVAAANDSSIKSFKGRKRSWR
jgi:hypothetical protein